MKSFPELLICSHCDSVYHRPRLAPGEAVRCTRCREILLRQSVLTLDQWLALTLGAAIVWLMANCYPLVGVSLKGLHNEVTLWQAALSMGHGSWAAIAVPAALAAIVVPSLQIVMLAWVLLYACRGRRAPGFATVLRMLLLLKPWSMVEVALLGVLVSAVKLSSLVQIVPGPGLWATAALAVLLMLIAHRDLSDLWQLPSAASRSAVDA